MGFPGTRSSPTVSPGAMPCEPQLVNVVMMKFLESSVAMELPGCCVPVPAPPAPLTVGEMGGSGRGGLGFVSAGINKIPK